MGDVSINYKGSTIAEMNDSGSMTLKTRGTYCEDDITVQYEKPTASEVTSGTKYITTNGTHDVTSYASADVNILHNVKYFTCTIANDIAGAQWVEFNPDGDADLAAHRADTDMCVMWRKIDATDDTTYHQHTCISNRPVNSYYGSCLLKMSSGSAASFINTPLTADASNAAKKTIIDTDGIIKACSSSQYPIRAGTYICIATW